MISSPSPQSALWPPFRLGILITHPGGTFTTSTDLFYCKEAEVLLFEFLPDDWDSHTISKGKASHPSENTSCYFFIAFPIIVQTESLFMVFVQTL